MVPCAPKGYRFNTRAGCMQEETNQCFSLTSLFFSLSLLFSLKTINISLGEDFKNSETFWVLVKHLTGTWYLLRMCLSL